MTCEDEDERKDAAAREDQENRAVNRTFQAGQIVKLSAGSNARRKRTQMPSERLGGGGTFQQELAAANNGDTLSVTYQPMAQTMHAAAGDHTGEDDSGHSPSFAYQQQQMVINEHS